MFAGVFLATFVVGGSIASQAGGASVLVAGLISGAVAGLLRIVAGPRVSTVAVTAGAVALIDMNRVLSKRATRVRSVFPLTGSITTTPTPSARRVAVEVGGLAFWAHGPSATIARQLTAPTDQDS